MAGKGPPRENAKGRRPAESAYLATVGSDQLPLSVQHSKGKVSGCPADKKAGVSSIDSK